MKTRIFKWTLSLFVLFLIFQSVNIVKADDDYGRDEHEEHESYERDEWDDDEEYDNWVDEEYEWQDDDDSAEAEQRTLYQETQLQQSYWNVWTKDTSTFLTENLPFQEAKEVPVEMNGKSESLYVVPVNGQLLVSGEKMAQLFGIKYKFYKQSQILEISNDKEELFVRAGSNAAYENMVKTPMPAKALHFENSIFLPISVIANAFGYRVNWNEEKGTITLKEIL
ncbi:copper amine oxidase N-terminal domain-containing protein [Neobacillus sp. FSL H8-0543]|uniref:copper amine oxidase N-terminal domain-containing protein n=1 Tax=Neobacillus sp. FSL H8-0543 TaxID=2954672 RepID=UPI003158EBA3